MTIPGLVKQMNKYIIHDEPQEQELQGVIMYSVLNLRQLDEICRAADRLEYFIEADNGITGYFQLTICNDFYTCVLASAAKDEANTAPEIDYMYETTETREEQHAEAMFNEISDRIFLERLSVHMAKESHPDITHPSIIYMSRMHMYYACSLAAAETEKIIEAKVSRQIGLPNDLCKAVLSYLLREDLYEYRWSLALAAIKRDVLR